MLTERWDSDCGRVTLYRGDCREIAPTLQDVDALVADPPYGMAWDVASSRFTMGGRAMCGRAMGGWEPIKGDSEPFDPAPWLGFRHVVLWGANHYAQRLPIGTTLVWLKRHDHLFGTFLSDAEIGWVKGGHGVYCHRQPFPPPSRIAEGGGKLAAHPTQKPIGLMVWAMARAKVPTGALVLDPFMGSGTTGVACVETGRRFIGIEMVSEYFETARRRISAALAQPRLFEHETPEAEQATITEANAC